LKAPGHWNPQRDNLSFCAKPTWYKRGFTYQPSEHTCLYLHVRAANYRSWLSVNGNKVFERDGGYTGFNREATSVVQAADNFVVAEVDNERHLGKPD
jgi:beta-glucuronidase